ncbi:endonuclease domain-containing protein [Compostimonas suwonensis]|uniref:Very-short-patch-repair endonuclease n=1 Tax=Compostimonas suwonensis TaxID=1048394 RepID=A0A2M9C4Q8_9MICO|nr:hypothetical protein [Compostimonas suwonensis]PJJ65492.1 hypothetical protein CLV54_0525 [Compostimonas suwonensis]
MPRRTILPSHLLYAPFTTADARAAGLNAKTLRDPVFGRPFHGVRVPPRAPASSVFDRNCRAYATRMKPTAFFTHDTAARLWNLPLPREYTADDPLHVSTFWPDRAPSGRGVAGHTLTPGTVRVLSRDGHHVVDPVSAWLQLGGILPRDELVALGDALVLDPFVVEPGSDRPWATIGELEDRLGSYSGRGVTKLRAALPLIREGSESRPETLLRLLLRSAGFPEPQTNTEIWDAGGRFLGRGDLVFRPWRVVVEYDGDHHRTDRRQYEHDRLRQEGLARAGWQSVSVRSRGLFVETAQTVERVRLALVSQGWR